MPARFSRGTVSGRVAPSRRPTPSSRSTPPAPSSEPRKPEPSSCPKKKATVLKTEINSSCDEEEEEQEEEQEEEEEEEEEKDQEEGKDNKIPQTEACNLDVLSCMKQTVYHSVWFS